MSLSQKDFLTLVRDDDYFTSTLLPKWEETCHGKQEALENILFHEAVYRQRSSKILTSDALEFFYRIHLTSFLTEEQLEGLKGLCFKIVSLIHPKEETKVFFHFTVLISLESGLSSDKLI
jgi:hypothetical protein